MVRSPSLPTLLSNRPAVAARKSCDSRTHSSMSVRVITLSNWLARFMTKMPRCFHLSYPSLFYISLFRARTNSTGTLAPRTTRSATLPINQRLNPECPRVHITIRSTSDLSCYFSMDLI